MTIASSTTLAKRTRETPARATAASRLRILSERTDLIVPYAGYIVLAMIVASAKSLPLYTLSLPLLAALQNHAQVLQHEGAHFHLHPNRRINDWLTQVFCSLPYFSELKSYRKFHFLHHKYLGDRERDPEIEYYASQGYYFQKLGGVEHVKLLMLDLCGYHFCHFMFRFWLSQERRAQLRVGAFWLGVSAVSIFLGGTSAVIKYWIVPQMTWGFLFLKLQGYAEHSGQGSTIREQTCEFAAGRFLRFFVFQYNTNRHLSHHLNPRKSWRQL